MFPYENKDRFREALKILIIEDDLLQSETLKSFIKLHLKKEKLQNIITIVDTKQTAEKILSKNNFDMAFFDLNLAEDDYEGVDLLKRYRHKVAYPAVLTTVQDESIMRMCANAGCKDYLDKSDFGSDEIASIFSRFITITCFEADQKYILSNYVTQDEYTKKELLKIPSIRNNNNVVFINGPTGTGKQIVAETIHSLITQKSGVFVDENCATFVKGLEESHLFGHKKGAFTGATSDQKGVFELADDGTLFLDEIGKLPLDAQAKLLKVIVQRKYKSVGCDKEKTFNGIIITASCENLDEMCLNGQFREDLYERIKGTVINLKSIRERKDDIEPLIHHFIKIHGGSRKILITDEALEILEKHSWPGNAREIELEVCRWHSQSIVELNKDHLLHLQEKPIDSGYEFFNNRFIEFTDKEDNNSKDLLNIIFDEVFRHSFHKNLGNVRNTSNDMGISHRRYYELKNRLGLETNNERQRNAH